MNMTEPTRQNKKPTSASDNRLATAIAIGAGVGVTFGIIIGNLAIGIAIGAALGIVFWATVQAKG